MPLKEDWHSRQININIIIIIIKIKIQERKKENVEQMRNSSPSSTSKPNRMTCTYAKFINQTFRDQFDWVL